ncbi:MAG: OmpA family protein [Sphingobacteriales bacterium]|nr:MAG: OmpA family protein [Sphingobacteriales bacterium]
MRSDIFRILFLTLLVVAGLHHLHAQDPAVKKLLSQADKLYNAYAYHQAIPLYRDVLLKDNLEEVKLKLAVCYHLTKDFENAEYWYRKSMENLPPHEFTRKLHFAQVLQTNGKCDEARIWFMEYGKHNEMGNKLAKGCDMIDKLTEHNYDFNTWLLPVNSAQSDFGPVIYNEGIVFCSNRQQLMGGKSSKSKKSADNLYLKLYFSQQSDKQTYLPPQYLRGSVNSQYNDGPITFSASGDTAIFTRNALFRGQKVKNAEGALVLGLYTAVKDNNQKWSNINRFRFNNSEDLNDGTRTYSMTHPFIAPDGQTLYLVSDMEGGYGGTDIYMCAKIDSTWSRPINLGPEINTAGNELFPYIHFDGNLFFASNGHPGLGGLDLFYTRYTRGGWLAPVNIGAPFNSAYDDFSLALSEDKNWGYFASNRPGGFGEDDIYFFEKVPDDAFTDAMPNTKKVTTEVEQPITTNALLNEALGMNKIRFKPGDWYIDSAADKELDKLVNYLKEWMEVGVEISAYTDSRGNDFVNLEISQKRAAAVRENLILKGIAPGRITTKGYGESMLLNHCVSGAECPEELHEQNNRIEIKANIIQGITNLTPSSTTPAEEEMEVLKPRGKKNKEVSAPQEETPELLEAIEGTTGVLQFKVFIGPFKSVDNNTYYNFAELNTPINLEYVNNDMMIVLGPYTTISEAEEFEKQAKGKGAKKTKLAVFKGNEPSSLTIKQLKKMGVQ